MCLVWFPSSLFCNLMCFTKLESFQPLFLKYFFCTNLLPSRSGTAMTYILYLKIFSHRYWWSHFFLIFSLLVFYIGWFLLVSLQIHWLLSPSSQFCHGAHPVNFCFFIRIFQLWNLSVALLFIVSTSLLEFSTFHSFQMCSVSLHGEGLYIITALKSNNPNFWVISWLESVDCIFTRELVMFSCSFVFE